LYYHCVFFTAQRRLNANNHRADSATVHGPAFAHVCNGADCQARIATACQRVHAACQCPCAGIHDEVKCPPCLVHELQCDQDWFVSFTICLISRFELVLLVSYLVWFQLSRYIVMPLNQPMRVHPPRLASPPQVLGLLCRHARTGAGRAARLVRTRVSPPLFARAHRRRARGRAHDVYTSRLRAVPGTAPFISISPKASIRIVISVHPGEYAHKSHGSASHICDQSNTYYCFSPTSIPSPVIR
jgi:hypothetical protein